MSANFVEIFWDARPTLMGHEGKLRPTPSPKMLALFEVVRLAVAEAFPDQPTALRVKRRGAEPEQPLRVVTNGRELDLDEVTDVEARIANALARGPAHEAADVHTEVRGTFDPPRE